MDAIWHDGQRDEVVHDKARWPDVEVVRDLARRPGNVEEFGDGS